MIAALSLKNDEYNAIAHLMTAGYTDNTNAYIMTRPKSCSIPQSRTTAASNKPGDYSPF